MNDRGFATFDIDSFGNNGGNGYTRQSQQQQQQQQQTFLSNNGPCMEEYDPTRLLNARTMSTYNSTGGRNIMNVATTSHQNHLILEFSLYLSVK